ncbi:unnamed protein product [Diatraea saccharalis]|uniref:Rad21/Rec8-like protein N-terminal domain-containing protein n=1 Tax=Diatraea saccharalis TaxID=40085 RepID=A0A9N9WFW6_9NEOP|nr:unnamed protein product [Diatraea saccharalis]
MFYDKNLMNSRHLGKVWRVANNIEVSCNEDVNMPIICNNLDSWIASRDEEPYKRLSLRTSAVLVDGAAKLYKRKINQLYEDMSMSPTFTENEEDNDSEDQSDIESDCNNENKASKSSVNPSETEIDCITNSTINNNDNKASSCSFSPSEAETDYNTNNTINNNKDKANSNSSSPREAQAPRKSMADKSIQKSPNQKQHSFNEDLPFGHIIIYDNYKDRIPSRIMFSSINHNIHKFA